MPKARPTLACSASLLALALILTGCGRKADPAADAAPDKASANPSPDASGPSLKQELTAVDQSLKAGSYDEAAAKLLKLKDAGAEFSQRDAASYRAALSEAYSKALEASQKGDPRAKATLDMIRAAQNH